MSSIGFRCTKSRTTSYIFYLSAAVSSRRCITRSKSINYKFYFFFVYLQGNLFIFITYLLFQDCFKVLERLAPIFYDLAQISPSHAEYCLVQVLKEKHSEFTQAKHKRIPSLNTVIFKNNLSQYL